MLAFYRLDGPFVAAAMKEPRDGVTILGDFQYLMQLTNGSSSWLYFELNFANFDDGTVRVVRLPDSDDYPPTLDEALRIRAALDEPTFKAFDSFEVIGPMLMARFPLEFEHWVSTTDQAHRASDFAHDVQKLRDQLPPDLSPNNYENSDGWSSLVEDFFDHYILEIDSKFSETGEREISMLIQLAPGDWVELGGFEGYETPTAIGFHHAEEADTARLIAGWLESHHAGYVAAIALLVEPDEESDEEDDDLWERIDEMKGDFYKIWEKCSLKRDCSAVGDGELAVELIRLSPQFAEFKRIIENPDGAEYRLLLELAERGHPGFLGQMGLFAEWSTK